MNDKVKIIIAVAVIIISIVFIARAFKKDGFDREYVVGCQSCGKIYKIGVTLQNIMFPKECKYCGENAVYRMFKCQECGTVYHFIPGSTTRCPKCDSVNVKQLEEVPQQ